MKNTLKTLTLTTSILFSSTIELTAGWPWSNTEPTEQSTAVVVAQAPKEPGYVERVAHPICRETASLFIPPILADPACYLSILGIKKLNELLLGD